MKTIFVEDKIERTTIVGFVILLIGVASGFFVSWILGILFSLIPFEFIGRYCYILTIPIGVTTGFILTGWLFTKSYYDVKPQHMGFRVNEFFGTTDYIAFSQGKGLSWFFEQQHDQIAWEPQFEEVEKEKISSKNQKHPVDFTYTVEPHDARYLLLGTSDGARKSIAKARAKAECVSKIKEKLRLGILTEFTEPFIRKEDGTRVILQVKKIEPSDDVAKSQDNAIEGQFFIETVTALVGASKKAGKPLTFDEASSIVLAQQGKGKYDRDLRVIRTEGENGNVKHEIETSV